MNDRDRKDFLWYLFGILAATPFVSHMFYRVWTTQGFGAVRAATSLPFVPRGVAGVEAIVVFGFGFYAGLLFLFANDYRKRYQGVLLTILTVVSVVVLGVFGIGVPNITPNLPNLLALLVGFGLGIATEGFAGELRDINLEKSSLGRAVKDDDADAEFRAASYGLVAAIVVLVVGMNLVHLGIAGTGVREMGFIGIYALASAVLFYFLNEFVQLDVDAPDDRQPTRLEVLGPRQSGKTYGALGLYLTALRSDGYRIIGTPSDAMRTIVRDYNEMSERGNDLSWNLGSTEQEDTPELAFGIEQTDGFHTRVDIRMFDHAGELLDDIAKRLDSEGAGTGRVASDGGTTEDEEYPSLVDEEESDDTEPTDWSSVEASDDTEDDDTFEQSTESFDDTEDDDTFEQSTESFDDTEDDDTFEQSTESFDDTEDDDTFEQSTESFDDTEDDDTFEQSTESFIDDTEDDDTNDQSTESFDDTEDDGTVETGDDGDSAATDHESKASVDRMIQNVNEADKLVFILDSERFYGINPAEEGEESMGINPLTTIADNTDIEEVILVATKADYFIEDWQQQEDGAQPQPHRSESHFDRFRSYVQQEMLNDDSIKTLSGAVNKETVRPIYFVTDDEDPPQPEADKYGNIQPVGFDDVLDDLLRDA